MSELVSRVLAALALAGWAGSVSAIPFEYRADQYSVNGHIEDINSPSSSFTTRGPLGTRVVTWCFQILAYL